MLLITVSRRFQVHSCIQNSAEVSSVMCFSRRRFGLAESQACCESRKCIAWWCETAR